MEQLKQLLSQLVQGRLSSSIEVTPKRLRLALTSDIITQGHPIATPPDSPTGEAPSSTFTANDLKRLLIDVIAEISAALAGIRNINTVATENNKEMSASPASPSGHSASPPDTTQPKQLCTELAQSVTNGSPQDCPVENKVEFKKVMEMYKFNVPMRFRLR
jgi:hypothetical protein